MIYVHHIICLLGEFKAVNISVVFMKLLLQTSRAANFNLVEK